MKIVFDVSLTEAHELLRCLQLGKAITAMDQNPRPPTLGAMVEQLSDVLLEVMKKDSSIGPTSYRPPVFVYQLKC